MGDTSDDDFFGAGKALSPRKTDRRESAVSAASEKSESAVSDVTKSSVHSTATHSAHSGTNTPSASDDEKPAGADDALSDVRGIFDDESGVADDVATAAPDEPAIIHEYAKTFDSNGSEVELDITEPSQLLIECERNRRKLYADKSDRDACLHEAVKCLAYTTIVYGDQCRARLAHCHAWIARVYWELFEYPLQTHHHAKQAIEYLRESQQNPVEGDEQTELKLLEISLMSAYLMGKALMAGGKYPEAYAWFSKANKLLHNSSQMKNFHSADFWRSEILAGLAKVSSCQQKYDDALDYLKQLETLITAKYGEKSMERCAVYKELAKCEENMNEYETAIDYLIQAHKMTRHTHKEESVEMGEVSAQLGELYAKTKMSERESFVETYFQQAVSSYRLACGEHDVRTLECRQRWVNALKTIGAWSDAQRMVDTLTKDYTQHVGDYSHKTSNVYKLAAELYLHEHQNDKAITLLKRALNIETKLFGVSHSRTKKTQAALAILTRSRDTNAKSS